MEMKVIETIKNITIIIGIIYFTVKTNGLTVFIMSFFTSLTESMKLDSDRINRIEEQLYEIEKGKNDDNRKSDGTK